MSPARRWGVLTAERLEARVADIVNSGRNAYAAVFAVREPDRLVAERGTAFVNRLLARLFELIRATMPRSPATGQLAPTVLGCVGFDDNDMDDAAPAAVLRAMDDALGGAAALVVGLYQALDGVKFAERQDIESLRGRLPDPAGALDYAQAAATAAFGVRRAVEHFDYLTPDAALHASRTTETLERTQAAYARLERLGAVNARARNQLGLAHFAAGQHTEADQVWATIVGVEGGGGRLQASFLNNAAANRLLLGDPAGADALFERALRAEGSQRPDRRYRGFFGLAKHESGSREPGARAAAARAVSDALSGGLDDLPAWQVERLRAAAAWHAKDTAAETNEGDTSGRYS